MIRRRCPVHEGQVHGGEASELRRGVEELLDEGTGQISRRALQRLLDQVDARDSLAHEEARELYPSCFEPEEPDYDTASCPGIGTGGRHSAEYSEDGEWVCDFCGARPRDVVSRCAEPSVWFFSLEPRASDSEGPGSRVQGPCSSGSPR